MYRTMTSHIAAAHDCWLPGLSAIRKKIRADESRIAKQEINQGNNKVCTLPQDDQDPGKIYQIATTFNLGKVDFLCVPV